MAIVRAGGETFNFPDGTSEEEMKVALDKHFQVNPPQAPQPVAAHEQVAEPDLLDRMGSAVSRGYEGAKEALTDRADPTFDTSNVPADIQEKFGTPTQSPMDVARSALAPAVTGVAEAAMEPVIAAIPDAIKDPLSEGAQAVMNTEPVRAAVESGKKLAEQFPYEAEALGETLTLGALGSPKVPVKTKTNLGGFLEGRAMPKYKQDRVAKTVDLMTPDEGGDGVWEIGKRGKKEYQPTSFEVDVAEEVGKIKKINPRRSATYNQGLVRAEARKLRDKLVEDIDKAGNPRIDNWNSVGAELDTVVDNMLNKPEAFTLSGSAKDKAKVMVEKLKADIASSNGRAKEILQIRKDFDKWIKAQQKGVYDPDTVSAASYASKEVRDFLNGKVEQALQGTGVNIRPSLDKQHKLLKAMDNLDDKVKKEGMTSVSRFVRRAEDAVGTQLPRTPLAQLALPAAAGATIAGSPQVAAVLGTALLAGTAIGGARWLTSPRGKMAVSRLIKAIEKDPTLSKYGLDRAALIDLMNAETTDEDEEF